MEQYEVFICHHSTSAHIAHAISVRFELKGIHCWDASKNLVGTDYAQSVINAIQKCRVFLILLDSEANESREVLKEIQLAIKRERNDENIIIVPFLLDSYSLPSKFQYHLAMYNLRYCQLQTMNHDIQCLVDDVSEMLEKQIRSIKEETARRMASIKPYSGKENFIFVSYSHKNTEKVLPVIGELQDLGHRVWYDEGIDPGTEWADFIASRIEDCACMMAFISQEYLASENCKDELDFARELGKNRMLVYLEDVALPRGMAMRLNRLHAVHAYRYNTMKDFVEKLITADAVSECH